MNILRGLKMIGLVSLVFIMLVLLFALSNTHRVPASSVQANPLTLIYATTTEEQQLGLGQRDSLPADEGMLFVFDHSDTYGFWMKDMRFPIDIIWLDENSVVTHIAANVQPSSYPATYHPETPSRFVLEVNAGYAAAHDIRVGSKVDTH